jgi:uncharacterized membrane protein YhaH (DUF805 family)
MINQQLLYFIKLQLENGSTRERITGELKANGWTAQDIEEAFGVVSIPTPSIPTPPSSSSVPPFYTNINSTITPAQIKNKSNWNPFSHKGRIGRLRFFTTSLIYGIVGTIISVAVFIFSFASIMAGVAGFFGNLKTVPSMSEYLTVLLTPFLPILILCIIGLIISLSLSAKRFHDLNKSGWYSLALAVPFYNVYLGLGLLLQCGTEGANQYGDDSLPIEKNHNDFLNKLGSSVTFKIIVAILLFILSISSSYQNNLDKKQAEQKLQQDIANSLINTPPNTNNSTGTTAPSPSIPTQNTTTNNPAAIKQTTKSSDITSDWKSKEVYNASNPSVCYTIKYPSELIPHSLLAPGFLWFEDPSAPGDDPRAVTDGVRISAYANTTIDAKSSENGFIYNFYSKKLSDGIKTSSFITDGGLKGEEFLPLDGGWFFYVAMPGTGNTTILEIEDPVLITGQNIYNVDTVKKMVKTITPKCGQ